jgi:DNA invertase Pin-like site-specific DNA recombinase
MLIGYARASTNEQDTAAQVSAEDSGMRAEVSERKRPGTLEPSWVAAPLGRVQAGPLIPLLARCTHRYGADSKGKGGVPEPYRSDRYDHPAGRMMMQMVESFAEFERAMLLERTRAGLESTREAGRIGGAVRSCCPSSKLRR